MNKNNYLFKYKDWIPFIFICVYALLSAISLYMCGDDYIWFYADTDPDLAPWLTPNGRILSNKLTFFLVRSFGFRTFFVFTTLSILLMIISNLFDFNNYLGRGKYYIALICFIFFPRVTYGETVTWISAYANYVFSMLIVGICIFFFYKCFFNGYTPKIYSVVFLLLFALMGGLCVEHVTIYNAILAITFLVLAFKLNKNCIIHAIFFLIGALLSCFIMFGNEMYSGIYKEGDTVGNRYFEIEFVNILQNAFSYVVNHYSKDYWIISIIITISFTILYFKTNFKKTPKYLKICMIICWLYMSYSFFTICISNLRILSPAMRSVAIETAFTFIYVVAIAYLIYVFLDKNGRIRSYIYLLSTLIVTAPFLIVSPVTARCFFANKIFWMLLGGEILSTAFVTVNRKYKEKFNGMAFAVAFCSVFLVINACLTNKYVDALRFNYIKEQLKDEKNRTLELILLPYTEFAGDDLKNGLLFSENSIGNLQYSSYIQRYHGIDYDSNRKLIEVFISLNDYYIAKDEETNKYD